MLSNLEGRGWIVVDPPEPMDDESVVGRIDGDPIKAGFMMDVIEDTASTIHTKYRSGQYDLEVKVDFDIGRGQVKVDKADGYED
jgi:hypothetical protein